MADLKTKTPRATSPALRGRAPRGSLGAPDMFLYLDHPEVLEGHLPGCPRVLVVEVIGSGIAHREGIRWHATGDRSREVCACCGEPAGPTGWTYLTPKGDIDNPTPRWAFMCGSCVDVREAPDAVHVRPHDYDVPSPADQAQGLCYPKPDYLTVAEALAREATIFAAEDERWARQQDWEGGTREFPQLVHKVWWPKYRRWMDAPEDS